MENEITTRRYTVDICDDCMNLRGDMCHNPHCAFCRKTMKEVDTLLEGTMIKVDIAQYKQKGKIIKF